MMPTLMGAYDVHVVVSSGCHWARSFSMFGHCVTQTGKYFSKKTGVDTETTSPGEEVQLYDSYAI